MRLASQQQCAYAFGLALSITAGLLGCSSPAKEEVVTAETSSLKPLSVLYGHYQTGNQNRPPANEADFKRFIKNSGQLVLQQFDITIDELFVSPRDDQPYVVLYRSDSLPPSGIVAYEREGVGGQRLVAYPFGAVSMVDEVRFRELVPDAS